MITRNRYGRQIRFSRYRPAKTWEELGLIGDSLRFTDDDIVTKQAIGYTKELCNVTCPMDIAVVYSMLHEGEGADITSKQLVNAHTRLASLYESGVVADGFHVADKEKNCDGYSNKYNANYDAYAPIDATKAAEIIKTLHEDNASEEMWSVLFASLTSYTDNKNDDNKHLFIYGHWRVTDEASDIFTKFAKKYPDFVTGTQWTSTKITAAIRKNLIGTDYENMISQNGYCYHAYEGCQTHNPDWQRGWVFHESLKPLYKNQVVSSYGSYDTHISAGDTTLLRFPEHQRKLVQEVNDKVVTRLISKSLTRMEKRGVVKQTSHGRGRTFQWIAWEWLQDIQNRILASNAKQRKLGDKVNGWEYTKGTVTESYGMEICDHDWKPVTPIHYYKVRISIPKRHWHYTRVDYEYEEMPVIFYHENDAQAYCDHLNNQDLSWNGGTKMFKTIDADFNEVYNMPSFEVEQNDIDISVDGTAMIEDYLEPIELYKRLQQGGDDEYKSLVQTLRSTPKRLTITKVMAQ